MEGLFQTTRDRPRAVAFCPSMTFMSRFHPQDPSRGAAPFVATWGAYQGGLPSFGYLPPDQERTGLPLASLEALEAPPGEGGRVGSLFEVQAGLALAVSRVTRILDKVSKGSGVLRLTT